MSGKQDHNRNESLVGKLLEVCLVLGETLEVWDFILLVLLFLGVMVVSITFLFLLMNAM